MENTKRGKLFVISGPAGSGKGTVMNLLTEKSGDYALSVSLTSRPMLAGEAEGVNYYYVTREQFEEKISQGEVLEYTEYCGNYYGTPKAPALKILDSGKHLLLEIEVDGAMQIKRAYPEAILVMILPPSAKVQEYRLRTRGRDSEESIQKRLTRTRDELKFADKYDYVLLNEDGAADKVAMAFELIASDNEGKVEDRHDTVNVYFE